jgi:hypothetical protein
MRAGGCVSPPAAPCSWPSSSPAAQIQALASYGINARLSNRASFSTLEEQIAAGIPIPCGYLHRGPISSPAGGGHWLIVVGITPSHLSCVERILQRSSGRPLRRTWIEFPCGEEGITLLKEEVLAAIQRCLQRVVDAVFRVGKAFS